LTGLKRDPSFLSVCLAVQYVSNAAKRRRLAKKEKLERENRENDRRLDLVCFCSSRWGLQRA